MKNGKLNVIWKNRKKILEGILNTYFPNAYIKKIAKDRSRLCQSNVCGLYDKKGIHENCFVPGKPCCTGCGCNEILKVHSLSSYCTLKDMGKTPLWDLVMSHEEEDKFKKKNNIPV